jgi:hypothetical protein
MTQIVTVPLSIDDSTKLQKLINSTGNTHAKYEFSPDHEIEINSLLRVFNFTEWDGQGCKFALMENAPLSPFASGVPLIAPKYPTAAEGLCFHDIIFDGRRDTQKYAKDECKSRGKNEWGQGYHNTFMLGSLNNVKFSNAVNCEFYNLGFYNSLGDGIRIEGGTDIRVHDILGKRGGHDIVCLAGVNGGEVSNVNAKLAVNAGVRTRSSKNIKIHDCILDGATGIAYSPGIQIQSTATNWITDNIEIYNNYIHDTYGPGIWLASNVPGNSGVNIHNNLILRCGRMPAANNIPGVGGIVYDGMDAISIKNNTIVGCMGYGILAGKYQLVSSYKGTAELSKNIVSGTRKSRSEGLGSGSAIANLTTTRNTLKCSDNCLWDNSTDLYQVSQTGGIYKDPLFTSDYRLSENSPCKGYGCFQDQKASKLLITCDFEDVENITKSLPDRTILRRYNDN